MFQRKTRPVTTRVQVSAKIVLARFTSQRNSMQRNQKGIVTRPTERKPGPTECMTLFIHQDEHIKCDFCTSYNVRVYASNRKEFSRGIERVGSNICDECLDFIYKEARQEPLSTSG